MTLQAQLELADVFSSNAFIVKGKQLSTNGHGIDIFESHWEKHLTVPVQLLEHVRVAVFQDEEKLFDALKDEFLRLRRVDPFGKVVE